MRLIDADKLYKHKFKSTSERMDLDVEYMFGWNDAIDSIIENSPTVDAEPVRHGHWKGKPIAGYSDVRCSECRDVFMENSGRWNYCPNCGAKMDGERREDV